MSSTISITERAQRELSKLDIQPDAFLRITVVPGGCSGMTYSAAIDQNLGADDQVVFATDGLRIACDAGSAIFLEGLRIDYSDDLVRSGFRFTNPNASGSCGCGSSFAG